MRDEKYRVFWPEREEFVRMAARFDAIIVPFAGVGCEDSFEILRDPQELRNTPFLGPWLEGRVKNTIPSARRCGVASAAPTVSAHKHTT